MFVLLIWPLESAPPPVDEAMELYDEIEAGDMKRLARFLIGMQHKTAMLEEWRLDLMPSKSPYDTSPFKI